MSDAQNQNSIIEKKSIFFQNENRFLGKNEINMCNYAVTDYRKMFSVTHKTVIVLDRCPYFLESSQQPVEFDMPVKSKVAGVIPLAPITKSLWTCNVEAVLEYIRVVYDLFPSNKLVRIFPNCVIIVIIYYDIDI